MVIQSNENLSRRGLIKHKENPFLSKVAENAKIGTRKITSKLGDNLMVVNSDGESERAGFWHTQEVDKSQFVKLYISGVRAFKELSGAGTRVFEVLYMRMQDAIGKDFVYMQFAEIDQDITKISKMTYSRGMSELLSKGFIAETLVAGKYFINPDYLFNGNRLQFAKEYRLKSYKIPKDQIAREELENLGQQRLTE